MNKIENKNQELVVLNKKYRRHQAILIERANSKIFGEHTTVYLATPNGRPSQYLNGYQGYRSVRQILAYLGISKTEVA